MIEWSTLPAPVWIGVAALIVVLLPIVLYRAERPAREARLRAVAAVCRALALAALGVAALGPGCRDRQSAVNDASTAVLLDTSRSMAIRDASGRSRLDRARAWLRRKRAPLEATGPLSVFAFARDRRAVTDVDGLRADGDESRLRDVVHAMAGDAFERVVVLTDGRGTTARTVASSGGERGTTDAVHVAAICFEDDGGRDVGIAALDAPTLRRPGAPITVAMTITARRADGTTVEARLRHGERIVARRTVKLTAAGVRLSLTHTPESSGAHDYTVEVDASGDELDRANNRRTFTVDVSRTKLRVLLIDGRPRWFYRHVKNAAVRDPRLVVDTVLTDADFGYVDDASPGREPLARFPGRRALAAYDAVLIGDVDVAHPRILGAYRDAADWSAALDDFARAGGGIVYVAGPAHAAAWLGASGPRCLPVRRATNANPDAYYSERAFRLRVTPTGAETTALRVLDDAAQNRALLEGRPFEYRAGARAAFAPFYGRVRGVTTRPGAIAWLTANESETAPDPVLAFGRFGAGRVVFCGTEETWLWREEFEDRFFYRFWHQILRRVARPAPLRPGPTVTIKTDSARVGDPIAATVRGDAGDVDVLAPAGTALAITRPDGAAAGTLAFVPQVPGLHRITQRATGAVLARVRVRPADGELAEPMPDRAGLVAWLGAERVFGPDDGLRWPASRAPTTSASRLPRPAWNRWWWLGLFVGLLTVEWICRVRMRLL